jgi:hypothetical protein
MAQHSNELVCEMVGGEPNEYNEECSQCRVS